MISVIIIILAVALIIGIALILNTKDKKMENQKDKKEKPRTGKAKKTIISIGIAILFVMFVAYAIESFYPSPKYEDFCQIDGKQYFNQTDCEANDGTWTNYPPEAIQKMPNTVPLTGYCDVYVKCQKEFQDENEKYNRGVFFIALTIGIIILAISFIPALEQISLGVMSGAILLIVYGTIRYWGNLSNIWKTIMIGLALAVLIWISYKKLNR